MKTFQLIESTTYDEILDQEITTQSLKVTEGEKVIWVSPESGSPRYAEYLRYTKWIEAGNNPEDFWNRSDDLNETVVSEDTLPSKEETKIETDLGE